MGMMTFEIKNFTICFNLRYYRKNIYLFMGPKITTMKIAKSEVSGYG